MSGVYWIVKKSERGETWFVEITLASSRGGAIREYLQGTDLSWAEMKRSRSSQGIKLAVVKVRLTEIKK